MFVCSVFYLIFPWYRTFHTWDSIRVYIYMSRDHQPYHWGVGGVGGVGVWGVWGSGDRTHLHYIYIMNECKYENIIYVRYILLTYTIIHQYPISTPIILLLLGGKKKWLHPTCRAAKREDVAMAKHAKHAKHEAQTLAPLGTTHHQWYEPFFYSQTV